MLPRDLTAALARALAGRTDVQVAILFGSGARGTAHERSDVDVAVDAPGVDVLELADATIPLLEEIVRDGIVVHEGTRGAGALLRSRTLAMLETDRPWFARMRRAWLARVRERGLDRG